MKTNQGTLTRELVTWHRGDPKALDRAWLLAYEELRKAAKAQLARASRASSLSATTLIQDAYIRFKRKPPPDFQCSGQFFCFASKTIRHMIVDHFRHKKVCQNHSTLMKAGESATRSGWKGHLEPLQILAIDDALAKLETSHPRRAQITLLRFYGGFNLDEIAEVLEISISTVKRDWRMARMWFAHELGQVDMSNSSLSLGS